MEKLLVKLTWDEEARVRKDNKNRGTWHSHPPVFILS